MTPEELRTNVWASKYAQLAADHVETIVNLSLAQQRIKELDEILAASAKRADVIPIKKEE